MAENAKPFVLAHVSDLHVSTFGDTFHERRHLVKRTARVADVEPGRWEIVWEEAGWRVLHARSARRGKVQLVDPDGYAHPVPKVRESAEATANDPVERAAERACRLEARRSATLAAGKPSDGALSTLLAGTPYSSNLRLLRAAQAIDASDVDAVLITGDLTDDGAGYELIESAFSRFKNQGRLFAVPGNHDLYLFPIAGSERPRPTPEGKRVAWTAFAGRLGLELDVTGAWVRDLPEAETVLVGLDSCARPQRRFFRHNGAIGDAQLAWLRALSTTDKWKKARHRLVALHHHVVPLPHGIGRGAPSEIGMRLDDSKTVAEVFDEIGATFVMHGHRHVSEQRQPAGSNFRILASPSLTLGCRSGDVPSYWRVELGERAHAERIRVQMDAVERAPESMLDVETETETDFDED